MKINNSFNYIAERTGLSETTVKRLVTGTAVTLGIAFDMFAGGNEFKKMFSEGPVTTVSFFSSGVIGAGHAWILKKRGSIFRRLKIEMKWAVAGLVIGLPIDYKCGYHPLTANHLAQTTTASSSTTHSPK